MGPVPRFKLALLRGCGVGFFIHWTKTKVFRQVNIYILCFGFCWNFGAETDKWFDFCNAWTRTN